MGHDKDHPLDCTFSHLDCEDSEDFDATPGKHGLMPKADKIKLAAIAPGAQVNMTEAFIFLYRTDVLDLTNNNTWYDVPFNIESPCKKNVTHDHTSNPEQITLPGGAYRISYRVSIGDTVNYNVGNCRLLDDGTEIPGSYSKIGNAVPGALGANITASFMCFIRSLSVIELQAGTHNAGTDIVSADNDDPDPTTRVVATITIRKISADRS